ncbi:MAG: DUF2190 family protein [Phycisphaeraceae bacterium]|nr:DUF2190 family protein [Phycisphaeraceae bacterium]
MPLATFVHDGDAIDYTPTSGSVAAGDVVVLGDLIGIAKQPIADGALGALAVVGVFDVRKPANGSVDFGIGEPVYWDATNQVAAATDGGGTHKLLGLAVRIALDNQDSVRVLLGR